MTAKYVIFRRVPCRPEYCIIMQYSLFTFRTSRPHELQLYTRPQQTSTQPSLRATTLIVLSYKPFGPRFYNIDNATLQGKQPMYRATTSIVTSYKPCSLRFYSIKNANSQGS